MLSSFTEESGLGTKAVPLQAKSSTTMSCRNMLLSLDPQPSEYEDVARMSSLSTGFLILDVSAFRPVRRSILFFFFLIVSSFLSFLKIFILF